VLIQVRAASSDTESDFMTKLEDDVWIIAQISKPPMIYELEKHMTTTMISSPAPRRIEIHHAIDKYLKSYVVHVVDKYLKSIIISRMICIITYKDIFAWATICYASLFKALFGCCRIHLNPHVLEWIGVEL
jgi:hypothetical protein